MKAVALAVLVALAGCSVPKDDAFSEPMLKWGKEPIMLEVLTSQALGDGVYRFYDDSAGIVVYVSVKTGLNGGPTVAMTSQQVRVKK